MGWSSGSEVAERLINSINRNVKDTKVKKCLYKDLIEALTDQDWDCIDEVLDLDYVFDNVAEGYLEDE